MNLVDAIVLVDPEEGEKLLFPGAENFDFSDFSELVNDWRLPLSRRAEVMPLPTSSAALPTLPPAQADGDAIATSWRDYPIEFAKGAIEGAKSVPASAFKGMAANSKAMVRQRLEGLKSLETPVPAEDNPFARASYRIRRGAIHPSPDVIAERRALLEREISRPLQDDSFYKAGDLLQGIGKEVLSPRPGFMGSWTRDIGGGFGSLFSGIGLSLLSRGAAMLLYVTAGQGEAADRAIRAGATEEQIRRAAKFGTLAGATDVVDLMLPMLGTTGKVAGFIKRIGMGAIKGAFAEGGQEGVQQLIQNAIAQGIYDPNQDVAENVVRSAIVATIVGGTVSGAAASTTNRQGGGLLSPGSAPSRPELDLRRPSSVAEESDLRDFSDLAGPNIDDAEAIAPSNALRLRHNELRSDADLYADVRPANEISSHRSKRQSDAPRKLPNSPLYGHPVSEWWKIVDTLIKEHPLGEGDVAGVVDAAWRGLDSALIAKLSDKAVSDLMHTAVAEQLQASFPGTWRRGIDARRDKDLVFISESDTGIDYSIELKVISGNKIAGNKAYARGHPGGGQWKSKNGFYIVVLRRKGELIGVEWGWIDQSDWKTYDRENSQSAYLPAIYRNNQLKSLSLPGRVVSPWPRLTRPSLSHEPRVDDRH